MKKLEPIGKYIHLTDTRNFDLSVNNLVGLTVEKRFIPSVANVIGTDLSKYKVIKQGQFACSLMQVSRDGKMPVAMYKGEPAIMSPAYPIFEVQDENNLLPEYLHMYLSRPEFDREAVFRAVGGVRGSLDWNDFIEMKIPIPDIDVQRKIVAEYQTIEKRIENNNRLIKLLEETAQNIYYHTFVENIDPKNLPEGWRVEPFYNYFDAKYGKGLATEFIKEQGLYPVYGANGVIGYYDEKTCDNYRVLITSRGSGSGDISRTFYKESFVTNNAFVVYPKKNYEYCELPYIYCLLCNSNVKQFVSGSAQPQLTNADMNVFKIVFPKKENIEDFCRQTSPLFQNTILLFEENNRLQKTLPLLLSKLS